MNRLYIRCALHVSQSKRKCPPEYDGTVALPKARRRYKLKQIMEKHGHAPTYAKWNSLRCPFCDHKPSAGVIERDGRQWFKCIHSSCQSTTSDKAFNEISYLAYREGINRKEATVQFLRQAGVDLPTRNQQLSKGPSPGIADAKRGITTTRAGKTSAQFGSRPSFESWAIDVDRHELGCQECSREKLAEALDQLRGHKNASSDHHDFVSAVPEA